VNVRTPMRVFVARSQSESFVFDEVNFIQHHCVWIKSDELTLFPRLSLARVLMILVL